MLAQKIPASDFLISKRPMVMPICHFTSGSEKSVSGIYENFLRGKQNGKTRGE
jgi:hypothetical protein